MLWLDLGFKLSVFVLSLSFARALPIRLQLEFELLRHLHDLPSLRKGVGLLPLLSGSQSSLIRWRLVFLFLDEVVDRSLQVLLGDNAITVSIEVDEDLV